MEFVLKCDDCGQLAETGMIGGEDNEFLCHECFENRSNHEGH
jgi:formylmethanofuran dehydrogenase subunit E